MRSHRALTELLMFFYLFPTVKGHIINSKVCPEKDAFILGVHYDKVQKTFCGQIQNVYKKVF